MYSTTKPKYISSLDLNYIGAKFQPIPQQLSTNDSHSLHRSKFVTSPPLSAHHQYDIDTLE